MILLLLCRCGHCQGLVPEYKKAASALKGIVRLGAVNADEHSSLGSQYGVKGFPTIKIFGSNKNSPTDYKGEHGELLISGGKIAFSSQLQDQRMLLCKKLSPQHRLSLTTG